MNCKMSLADRIENNLSKLSGSFTMSTLYSLFPEEKRTTLRGRVYDGLLKSGRVQKIAKGIYQFASKSGHQGVVLQGDARELEMIKSDSVDLIIADHPYVIQKGSNRNFNSSYIETSFRYNLQDFINKARVLRDGAFLIEFLPEFKETNIDYLMDIINMARQAGFKFYAKIPWFKAEIRDGKLVDGSAFVGRKAVLEEIYIFTKGAPRKLRSRKQGDAERVESGAKQMLPAVFINPPVSQSKKIHQSEKPIDLLKKLIEVCSDESEVVLDQFAGSFSTFWAALDSNRNAIAIELSEKFVEENFVEQIPKDDAA